MEKNLKNKYFPILVEWEDFALNPGWKTLVDVKEAIESPYLVQSIGFLVSGNKDRLVLTYGYTLNPEEEDGYQGMIQVPTGLIRKITFLGAKKNAPSKIGCIKVKRRDRKSQRR